MLALVAGSLAVSVRPDELAADSSVVQNPDYTAPAGVLLPEGNTCRSVGDPHMRTFWGDFYDFMEVGEYTFVNDMNEGALHREMSVYSCPVKSWMRSPGATAIVAMSMVTDDINVFLSHNGSLFVTDTDGTVSMYDCHTTGNVRNYTFKVGPLSVECSITPTEQVSDRHLVDAEDTYSQTDEVEPEERDFVWFVRRTGSKHRLSAHFVYNFQMRSEMFYQTWTTIPKSTFADNVTGICMGPCKRAGTPNYACDNNACLPVPHNQSLFPLWWLNEVDALCSNPANGYTYEMIEKPMTFVEAAAACGDLGGRIAVIRSEDENEAAKTARGGDRLNASTLPAVWLGAADVYGDGNFTWLDTTPVAGPDDVFYYRSWEAGFPKNTDTACMTQQRAVSSSGTNEMRASDTYNKWEHAECDAKLPVVCEIPIPQHECDHPQDVLEICQSSDIYELGDGDEDVRRIHVYENYTLLQMGELKCAEIRDGSVEGEAYYRDCVYDFCALRDDNVAKQYKDIEAEDQDFAAKGNGDKMVAGLAPCEYKYYTELLTFDDAEASCQSLGLQLAILLDAEDNRRALASVPANATVVSWIGSHDQDVEGKWTWLPSNIPATWTNWDEGEPNSWNGDTLEDCTVMKNFNGKWNDIRCSNEFAYICENANSCPKYAAPPPAPDSSVGFHGDPKFVLGDERFMVYLPPHENHPLLIFGSQSGPLKLTGSTMSSPALERHAPSEWFNGLEITASGRSVLKVSVLEASKDSKGEDRAARTPTAARPLAIYLDGNHVDHFSAETPSVSAESQLLPGLKVSRTSPTAVSVQLPQFNISLESEKATKFMSPELQSKYEHLNLQLSKVPADAKGLMAELSGLQQLSAATKAALATPNAVVHKRKEHSRKEHLRKEHERRSKNKQGMIDAIKAKGSATFPGKRRSGGSALQAG